MKDRGALATMTAMANEMSPKYKHLRNGDCFANIAFFSYSIYCWQFTLQVD